MLRPIIDEYVLAKIMNKICPAKFTDEWVHEVKKNYQKSFLTPEIVNHWDSCSNASSNENLLVQMRLSDDGFGLNNNSFNPERNDLITNMNGKNNNNVHTRDRGMYLKSLEDTVAFIARNSEQVSQLPQQHHQLNNPSQSQQPISADVNELLQDIRNYFLANDAIEERRRHFSSISDGSSSSESSNNNSNRQFENILQKIFDFSQICDDQKISNGFDGLGNLNFDQAFNDAFQAARQIESREELSSGYGRSSSASSSNDSANPLSIGNAPTHGSLTVNIGSVLSDSGNGSPTTGLFCVKNSSSSASSFTQETNGLNMKEYLDDTIPDLKRNRVNTNPADEMFRLNDRISPGASLSSHDSEVQINNPGLYFDTSSPCFYDEEKRMFANNIPSEPVSVSTWDTPVTICQETSLTPTNSCFILSTGSRSVNRSFSVGASQKVEKVAPQLMNSNIRQDYDSFSPNLMNSNDFKRKKVYEFIVGQLYADGYQNIANQILQAEGLSGLNFSNNTKLQNLTSSKMRISNESFPSESELFIPQQTSSNVDSFFNTTNSFGQRLNNAVYDSSFGSFNRSNSVSVTIANNVMPNKMFISNRSQSQVAVTNSLNMTPQPIPMTAPALLDSSNFMLNENAMKNINQLAIKLNMEQHLNGSHNDVSNLMMAGSRLNSLAKTPCHTTGNGKTCKEMSIKAKFGNLGAGINQFSSPHGFCLGFNEELVIADTTNHRICVYDKNGKFKSSFGTPGREEGQLYNPRKIATIVLNRGGTESQCYVICDRGSERSRMQIFTRSGTFVRKILITFMEIVAGIAVNSRGQIVAVDSVYSTIFTLDDQGSLKKFVECSDYMREPSDIAIYKDQYYICDFKGHYVAVFDMEGKFIRKIGGEGLTSFPNGIDIYPNGRVLVGDSHGNRFHIAAFTNDGNLIAEYECPHVKVSRCCGLKITREGLIVTLAKNNHHVLVLNPLA